MTRRIMIEVFLNSCECLASPVPLAKLDSRLKICKRKLIPAEEKIFVQARL